MIIILESERGLTSRGGPLLPGPGGGLPVVVPLRVDGGHGGWALPPREGLPRIGRLGLTAARLSLQLLFPCWGNQYGQGVKLYCWCYYGVLTRETDQNIIDFIAIHSDCVGTV